MAKIDKTSDAMRERLEVDNGDGSFVPYYVARMRKVEHYDNFILPFLLHNIHPLGKDLDQGAKT